MKVGSFVRRVKDVESPFTDVPVLVSAIHSSKPLIRVTFLGNSPRDLKLKWHPINLFVELPDKYLYSKGECVRIKDETQLQYSWERESHLTLKRGDVVTILQRKADRTDLYCVSYPGEKVWIYNTGLEPINKRTLPDWF
jgi:hypothetical protein